MCLFASETLAKKDTCHGTKIIFKSRLFFTEILFLQKFIPTGQEVFLIFGEKVM